jgi:hypothetical protein
MRYGIMPEADCDTLDSILARTCSDFPEGIIETAEIGVHKGLTSKGIHDRIYKQLKREHRHIGIDNLRDGQFPVKADWFNMIRGNSIEVFSQVEYESQHFIFIDGSHNYPMTMADFLCYSDRVIPGGYIAFHDTGKQIKPFTDYQGMGSKDDPYMYISCRIAIYKLGLLDNKFPGWRLISDHADESKPTGGITVVQKLRHQQGLNIQ